MAVAEGRESWKGRKAAIEDITAACDKSGHYIEANKASGDVIKALKARYVFVSTSTAMPEKVFMHML
jgi:hypothetical protein